MDRSKDKLDPLAIISKLAEEEKRFNTSFFLAPVVEGGKVRVRVSGIVADFTVKEPYEGWAILKVASPGIASMVRPAEPGLVEKYLRLFPKIRLVLIDKFESGWWALPASSGDTRIKISGPVPVRLLERGSNFDTIVTRFDGSSFWFESVDRRRDPAIASTLKRSLESGVAPDVLQCLHASPSERLVYKMLWTALHERDVEGAMKGADDRTRITAALKHADASLRSFSYRADNSAHVNMEVDGVLHDVTIKLDDLTVLCAGICLDGEDANFDLTSLVGVFREAARLGEY